MSLPRGETPANQPGFLESRNPCGEPCASRRDDTAARGGRAARGATRAGEPLPPLLSLQELHDVDNLDELPDDLAANIR